MERASGLVYRKKCNASGYSESCKKLGTANAAAVQNVVNQDDNIEVSDTAKAFLKKREAKETTQWLDVNRQEIIQHPQLM